MMKAFVLPLLLALLSPSLSKEQPSIVQDANRVKDNVFSKVATTTEAPTDSCEYTTNPFANNVPGEVINLSSDSCEDKVVMTELPHAHTDDDDELLELTMKIADTVINEKAGYQPQLVLFFAKQDATLDDVTTDDNGWPFFESQVVGWMKGKIHSCMVSVFYENYSSIYTCSPAAGLLPASG